MQLFSNIMKYIREILQYLYKKLSFTSKTIYITYSKTVCTFITYRADYPAGFGWESVLSHILAIKPIFIWTSMPVFSFPAEKEKKLDIFDLTKYASK